VRIPALDAILRFCAGGRFTAPSGQELTVPLPAGGSVPPVQSRARTRVARHHRALHSADQGPRRESCRQIL